MSIRLLFATLLSIIGIATPALAQQWQRFTVPSNSPSAVNVSYLIAPVAAVGTANESEPSLAVAQANAAILADALARYDTIEFTTPGRYYFAGRAILDSFTKLYVGPGVELWRHSGYVNQPWIHTIGTSQTTDIIITGGGLIGRVADETAANDNSHTLILWHTQRVTIDNITLGDTCGPNFTDRDGKYAIYGNRSYDWRIDNVRFVGAITDGTTLHGPNAIGSDGIHASGACERWIITNVSGSTADNSVAIMTRDYAAYETFNNGTTTVNFTKGDVKDFIIDGMNFWGSTELFRTTGRFEPIVRDNDLSTTDAAAPEGNVTGVAWTASTRQVSKTGLFNDYVWQEGDYLVVVGGTGVKRPGPGGEIDASDVSASEPLALPIVRRVSNDAVEVGILVGSGDFASMTILNGAYDTYAVENVVVRNVTGSVAVNVHGIGLALDDTADSTKLTQAPSRNIVLENINITVPTTGYALISVRGIQLESLELRGTIQHGPGSATGSPLIDHTGGRSVMNRFDASAAAMTKTATGTATFSVINWEASARLWRLGTLNIDNALTGGGCTAINLAGDATAGEAIVARIDDLDIGTLRHTCTNSGTNWGVSTYASSGARILQGRIGVARLENVTFGFTGPLSASAVTRSRLHVDDLRVIGTISAVTRGQADVTYDHYVRPTASGENMYGAAESGAYPGPTLLRANQLGFYLTEADFTTAGTSQIVTLSTLTRSSLAPYADFILPRGATVTGVRVEVLEAFDDGVGAMSASQIDVGVTATPDAYVSNFTTFATGGTRVVPTGYNAAATFPALAVRLETTGANVVAATTGRVFITVTFEQ
jgi:hypothetical protein